MRSQENAQISKPVIYLSGSIVSKEEKILLHFSNIAERLRALGYIVINPCDEVAGLNSIDATEAMRRRLMKMLVSHCVVVMEDWPSGEDALIELYMARHIGLAVHQPSTYLPELI